MREAIALAQASLASNDVPVGALIIDPSGKIIASGTNEREAKSDPTAHAEIVAMRKAATNGWRLDNHTLVVTLEPCAMCAGAIAQARISKVIFGAWDEKAGAAGSVWDVLRDPRAIHRVEVESGVLEKECAALLSDFFRSGK
ncbi:tRNA(adenine34) deaminase [Candidatus Planktophila limnetica]|uniref:tRNA-specific adenosine deaminase n=1 Tax=Candidatus Planktophila limnetica TaxID=573600 RepID=A0A249LHB2_9ACTN|nr:tRNA(adenine34) deaminase [Candidatus Planktophila limnetica]